MDARFPTSTAKQKKKEQSFYCAMLFNDSLKDCFVELRSKILCRQNTPPMKVLSVTRLTVPFGIVLVNTRRGFESLVTSLAFTTAFSPDGPPCHTVVPDGQLNTNPLPLLLPNTLPHQNKGILRVRCCLKNPESFSSMKLGHNTQIERETTYTHTHDTFHSHRQRHRPTLRPEHPCR